MEWVEDITALEALYGTPGAPSLRKVADRLIRAAEAELIATHGHLEMQAVAKRAKLSVGLAYHHFGSKLGGPW